MVIFEICFEFSKNFILINVTNMKSLLIKLFIYCSVNSILNLGGLGAPGSFWAIFYFSSINGKWSSSDLK